MADPNEILFRTQKNEADAVQALIDGGVDASYANGVGQTALHVACLWGNIDVAKVLVKAGAQVNAINNFSGAAPLHCAATENERGNKEGRNECIKLLVEAGADVNLRDMRGKKAQQYAVSGSGVRTMLGVPEEPGPDEEAEEEEEWDERVTRNWALPRRDDDFAKHAGQHEKAALTILGFPMTFNGLEIGPGNGLRESSYFIDDAVLQGWGVAPKRGRYSYPTGVWSCSGQAVRTAGLLSAQASRAKLPRVVNELTQVEDLRIKDMGKHHSQPPTTRCRPKCFKEDNCKDCNAVRVATSHTFQLQVIKESRMEMETLLRNLPPQTAEEEAAEKEAAELVGGCEWCRRLKAAAEAAKAPPPPSPQEKYEAEKKLEAEKKRRQKKEAAELKAAAALEAASPTAVAQGAGGGHLTAKEQRKDNREREKRKKEAKDAGAVPSS
mmetsp:Transcript_7861/g.19095  ORF Transcript_7861/g.19095 Transcript_7861/m.19095 type:complete len:439 (+) Transcript_7861:55-1371(+)